MFAGEVGTPRLLKLFKKYDIKATWFIPGWGTRPGSTPTVSTVLTLDERCFSISPPGHSLDTFPEQMAAVRDAGHEMCVPTSLCNPPNTPSLAYLGCTTQRIARLLSRGDFLVVRINYVTCTHDS
jgi:peptidoglycan/xylan/chitin deacetylase (PgdA/CDA1 family)